MQRLLEHGWKGNVRELQHVIQGLSVLAASEEISPADVEMALG
jgi:DNA-binding NtrC family response regulator